MSPGVPKRSETFGTEKTPAQTSSFLLGMPGYADYVGGGGLHNIFNCIFDTSFEIARFLLMF